MKPAFAVVALAAYSAMATAAPLGSLTDFTTPAARPVSPLHEHSVSSPAALVFGLHSGKRGASEPASALLPPSIAAFSIGSVFAFLAGLFGWHRSLRLPVRRRRKVKLVMRRMAPL